MEEFKSKFNAKYSHAARKIVGLLSEDSRIKLTEMAKKLEVSRRTATIKLDAIEKDLNLQYMLELDEQKLGLNRPHLILARFNRKPDYSKVKSILNRSHIPQVAVSIKGTYDMMIYANALSGIEYAHWDKSTQTLLAPYNVEWHSSEVAHMQLGFFPLRNELLERVNIKPKYKRIISILNSNSRISFHDLAKELNINVNTTVYNFNKILSLGYIRNFTATIGLQKDLSFMTFFSKYTAAEGYEDAAATARKAFTSDDDTPLISRYLITAPLLGSFDFFTLGAFDNRDVAYKKDVLYHKEIFKKYNVKMLYGEIDEILLGRLPIRSMDTKKNYKTLVWNTED